ncbi:MAG: hypothetical protein R3B65_00465 [Candidatus Paceibacterota bacterium]
MKKYIVIFFVWMLALPVFAQTSAHSKEWVKQVKEVVLTSDAWAATNAVVPGGIHQDMVNDKMWEDILFGYPTNVRQEWLKGDYIILLDGKNTLILKDTMLNVWVSDISVPFYIPPGVDVSGTDFLVPIYDGQERIIKSYSPSGEGQDRVLADAKKSLNEFSEDVPKLANVEWVEEGESFIAKMNGKDYFYQLDSASGKWITEDPDAPIAMKAGDRKKDPTFIFTKDVDGERNPSASNKRNTYKFLGGKHAGYQNNYYRHARNGAPLGSSGWMASPYYGGLYQSPFMGGGWNNYGIGGGFGGGFSFGFSFGGGYGNGFGCMPQSCFGGCFPNRWSSGGSAVWNGYALVGIDWVGSGVGWTNDPYYYGGYGSGGCKSIEAGVAEEQFVDFASAEYKVGPVEMSRSQEQFIDIGSRGQQVYNAPTTTKELTVEPVPIKLPASHTGAVRTTEPEKAPTRFDSEGITSLDGIRNSGSGNTTAGRTADKPMPGVFQGTSGANGRSSSVALTSSQQNTFTSSPVSGRSGRDVSTVIVTRTNSTKPQPVTSGHMENRGPVVRTTTQPRATQSRNTGGFDPRVGGNPNVTRTSQSTNTNVGPLRTRGGNRSLSNPSVNPSRSAGGNRGVAPQRLRNKRDCPDDA